MPVQGRALTAEDIEREVSGRFGPREFASLCNSVVWAGAGARPTQLPSFTERVNVPDQGVDAEWPSSS